MGRVRRVASKFAEDLREARRSRSLNWMRHASNECGPRLLGAANTRGASSAPRIIDPTDGLRLAPRRRSQSRVGPGKSSRLACI